MFNSEENKNRLYFSISEVSKYFKVNESTLRHWEKEFLLLDPRKSTKGTRTYSREDVKNIQIIYNLLKVKGLTVWGAKKELRSKQTEMERKQDVINRLMQLKSEVKALRDELDNV